MIRLYRRHFINALKKLWPVSLLVLLIFALGIAGGAWNAINLQYGQAKDLHDYLAASLPQFNHPLPDSSRAVRGAVGDNMIMVGVMYLSGLSLIGIPAVIALVFLRGYVLGFAVGFLCRDLAGRGVLLAAASIMPHNLLYLPALFTGAVASLAFAAQLLQRRPGGRDPLLFSLSRYTAIMVVVLAAAAGAGLVEACCSPWLTRTVVNLIGAGT
ncbi:stage II sporulation protein M [Desulfotomaculum copahuensis]|uniref:Stage II sporulation protein M n=1 Tax=Desulfotomaculum copahuensis TaxID=1838280 RepID=A0A1B7LIU7_9FIRM|nr:stage II sporulation protein M [Desulfotomaculum copahuensis]OAT86495.1 stage II sporulation protein M [Desulfotomaculum copahuensis]